MVAKRLEIRLDPERRRKLAEMLDAGEVDVSGIARHGIDLAYDEFVDRKRAAALNHLLSLKGDDMPDPRELKRQILAKYDPLP